MKRILLLSLCIAGMVACKHPQMTTANTRSLSISNPTDRPYSTLPPGVAMPTVEDSASAGTEAMVAVAPAATGEVSAPAPAENSAPAAAEPAPIVYRFLVSFFSEASGPDNEGMNAFKQWVVNYGNNLKMTIAYDEIKWGREGETEICFLLDKLSAEQQVAFINAANEQLKSAKRVNVYENQPCKHQPRK